MCFQRDSRKDQIIVWCFIIGTAGLLGWAAVKRALEAKGGLAGVELPGIGALRAGSATGRSGGIGRGLGDSGLQHRRAGGVGGGSSTDDAVRGAYSSIGHSDGAVGTLSG